MLMDSQSRRVQRAHAIRLVHGTFDIPLNELSRQLRPANFVNFAVFLTWIIMKNIIRTSLYRILLDQFFPSPLQLSSIFRMLCTLIEY